MVNFKFCLIMLAASLLTACNERDRPNATEIAQIGYDKCRKDFERSCKGKFIKFDGIVESVGGTYLRIKTQFHGFDVFGLSKIDEDKAVKGSKVTFSGYLAEDHFFNDDVVWGKIDAVLMTAAEVEAEKAKVAAETMAEKVRVEESRVPEIKAYQDEIKQRRIMTGPKKDLRGFFPGMSEAEFREKFETAPCSWAKNEEKCKIEDGALAFGFTDKLQNRFLKLIELKFQSGVAPMKMISKVSEQFGANPIKSDWRREIAHATEARYECLPNMFSSGCHDVVVVGGLIGAWELGDGLTLRLTLNSPAAGSRPNEYILGLTDTRIAKIEELAERRAREAENAQAKGVNPKPKF
jgi:hypothetical protein